MPVWYFNQQIPQVPRNALSANKYNYCKCDGLIKSWLLSNGSGVPIHKDGNRNKPARSARSRTDQDLAKGFVFQESQVLRQFTGIEVVEKQRHFPLFGHRWDALGHLPLPFIGRSGRDKEKQTNVSFLRPVLGEGVKQSYCEGIHCFYN